MTSPRNTALLTETASDTTLITRLFEMGIKGPWLRRLQRKPAVFFEDTEIESGAHNWGDLDPDGDFTMFDTRSAFIAAMSTRLPRFGLEFVRGPLAFNKKLGGFWEIRMPEWEFEDTIGHPAGTTAVAGERTWVATPTMELINQTFGVIRIENAWLPSPRPDGIYDEWKHDPSPGDLLRTTRVLLEAKMKHGDRARWKMVYGHGLAIVESGKGTLLRPDIVRLIRAESYARLWRKASNAVVDPWNRELLWMGQQDSFIFAGTHEEWPESFHLDKERVGALRIKLIRQAERRAT
jgi:hypothetical protein